MYTSRDYKTVRLNFRSIWYLHQLKLIFIGVYAYLKNYRRLDVLIKKYNIQRWEFISSHLAIEGSSNEDDRLVFRVKFCIISACFDNVNVKKYLPFNIFQKLVLQPSPAWAQASERLSPPFQWVVATFSDRYLEKISQKNCHTQKLVASTRFANPILSLHFVIRQNSVQASLSKFHKRIVCHILKPRAHVVLIVLGSLQTPSGGGGVIDTASTVP